MIAKTGEPVMKRFSLAFPMDNPPWRTLVNGNLKRCSSIKQNCQ